MENKTLVILALALICVANAQSGDFEGFASKKKSEMDLEFVFESYDAEDEESGFDCNAKKPCPSTFPVCNFDHGDSGFCEKCPIDCVEAKYHNPAATPICCAACPNAGSCKRGN